MKQRGRPTIHVNSTIVSVKLGEEHRERLEYHTRRLCMDMSDLVRDALTVHLDTLDEKEMRMRAIQREREQENAAKRRPAPGLGNKKKDKIPDAVRLTNLFSSALGPNGATNGAPAAPAAQPAAPAPVEIHEKLKRSFRRWSEYMESATSKDDAAKRMATVIEDVKERSRTNEEAEACVREFVDFLEERASVKALAKGKEKDPIVTLGESVKVLGDVDS